MGELIGRIDVKKEVGYLYYVKANEEGYLCVHKAQLVRGRRGKKSVPA